MSSTDKAAMLARELPVSQANVRHLLELGYSVEQIRDLHRWAATGQPLPRIRPAADVVAELEQNRRLRAEEQRWLDAFAEAIGYGRAIVDLDAPATLASHPELECWANRDPWAGAICDGSGMILDYGGPFDCAGCVACR